MSINFSGEEKGFLASLLKHKVRFLIVGMSGAVLQGAHVVTQDIDLWIEDLGQEPFCKAVKEVDGYYVPPGLVGMNPPMLGPGALRIFDLVTHMHGLDSFAAEYENSLTLEVQGLSLRVLPLERVIHSKTAANREKDRAVLPALKAALVTKDNVDE